MQCTGTSADSCCNFIENGMCTSQCSPPRIATEDFICSKPLNYGIMLGSSCTLSMVTLILHKLIAGIAY